MIELRNVLNLKADIIGDESGFELQTANRLLQVPCHGQVQALQIRLVTVKTGVMWFHDHVKRSTVNIATESVTLKLISVCFGVTLWVYESLTSRS